MATDTTTKYRVFISHGSSDRWIAEQIREKLLSADIHAFLDEADIRIGDDFRAIILQEIRDCHDVLALLTPSSLSRAWVFAEIGAAAMAEKRVVAIWYGLTMEELHDRGIVSLIGDVALTDLNDMDAYVDAVISRAGDGIDG